MASYSRRGRVTRHVEYLIPKGDTVAEFLKAWAAAQREVEGIDKQRLKWDDWARVDADDEHIIIRFEVPAGGESA